MRLSVAAPHAKHIRGERPAHCGKAAEGEDVRHVDERERPRRGSHRGTLDRGARSLACGEGLASRSRTALPGWTAVGSPERDRAASPQAYIGQSPLISAANYAIPSGRHRMARRRGPETVTRPVHRRTKGDAITKNIVIAVDTKEHTLDALALGRLLSEVTSAPAVLLSIFGYFPLEDPNGSEMKRLREEARGALLELGASVGLPAAEGRVAAGNFAARVAARDRRGSNRSGRLGFHNARTGWSTVHRAGG